MALRRVVRILTLPRELWDTDKLFNVGELLLSLHSIREGKLTTQNSRVVVRIRSVYVKHLVNSQPP